MPRARRPSIWPRRGSSPRPSPPSRRNPPPTRPAAAGTPAPTPAKAAGKLGPELLRAAWDGQTDKVRQLLSQGADPTYRDSDGFRAIDCARDSGHTDIVNLLQKAQAAQQENPAKP